MSNQVWVCGEVVIDLIPDGTERKAVVGGGPANTAKALSKLGIATQFIDGISSDKYGQMALKELHKDGVLLDFVKFSDKPTCLAIVSLNSKGGATLKKLEEMLKTGIPAEEEQRAAWQKTYDLLFGAKHPLIDTLATLVDLTIELEKAGKIKAAAEPQAEEYSFTASDVALVKSFIEKSSVADA